MSSAVCRHPAPGRHRTRKVPAIGVGHCTAHEGLLDAQHPRESLVIQKVVAGSKVCGSVMPITGGPRLLFQLDRACFVRWVEEIATAPR
jgi:hypothetical protein